MKPKEIIARRVALEFKDGDVVNLGFGIPNASADFIPEGVKCNPSSRKWCPSLW